MCWISKTKPQIKTATKNITVYKVGNKNGCFFQSGIRRYLYRRYEINSNITINPIKSKLGEFIISSGYHSFESKHLANLNIDPCFYGSYIAEFMIPKGSKYYVNFAGEIVSSNIVFIKYLKSKCSNIEKIIDYIRYQILKIKIEWKILK